MSMYLNAPRVPRYWTMNLQTFAEAGSGDAGDASGSDGNGEGNKDNETPSIETLMARLAAAEANAAKQKSAIDKLMKENGDLNKLYRDRLTADEKAKLEQADREAKFAEMEKRLAIYDAKARYLEMGMSSEMAEEVAGYEVAGEFVKMTEAFQKHLKTVRDNAVKDFIDGRKSPAAGSGSDDGDDTPAESLAKKLSENRPQRKLDTEALKNWGK